MMQIPEIDTLELSDVAATTTNLGAQGPVDEEPKEVRIDARKDRQPTDSSSDGSYSDQEGSGSQSSKGSKGNQNEELV